MTMPSAQCHSYSNHTPQLQRLARKFACSNLRLDTFQLADNKVSDQTAHPCRLVWAFVVPKQRRQGFSGQGVRAKTLQNAEPQKFQLLKKFRFKLGNQYNHRTNHYQLRDFEADCQPQNPKFRNNPKRLHPRIC